MARPHTIPIEKAALALNMDEAGYGPMDIARHTGLNHVSVHDILARHGRWGEVVELPVFNALRREQNQHLEAAFRTAAAKALERAFDEEKLEKASTYQLVMCSAVAIDKARLLAGESTENVAIHVDSVVHLDDLCARLAQRLTEPDPNR